MNSAKQSTLPHEKAIDRLLSRNKRAAPSSLWYQLESGDWIREYKHRKKAKTYVAYYNVHMKRVRIYVGRESYTV